MKRINRILTFLTSAALCMMLSFSAAAADMPASGQAGSSSIHVSVKELSPGYYLCAVWDGDELLTLFDATVGSDGILEQTVDVGKTLQQNDTLKIGISGENAGTAPITYPVVLSSSTSRPENSSSGNSSSSGSSNKKRPVSTNNANRTNKTNDSTTALETSSLVEAAPVLFADVSTSDWYYDAIQYICGKRLMSGVSESRFAPEGQMTRTMLVSVLYRMDGSPTVTGTPTFTDVPAGEWFTDAVLWAHSNGIVEGYSPLTFGSYDPVTREQLTAILYRYARFKGYDVSASVALGSFPDALSVSVYAGDAVRWAVSTELLSGTNNGTLSPQDVAARGQVAAILMRFCEKISR